MTIFTLKWARDQQGYHVERRAPETTGAILLRRDAHDVIVRNGGPLVEYEPFEVPALCRRLALTRSLPHARRYAALSPR